MKRIVSILVVLAMMITVVASLTTNVFAAGTTVTVDFTAQGYENATEVTSLTVDGVTLTFSAGDNVNPPKYYSSGTAVRLYGSNSMTVTAGGAKITAIAITFDSGEKNNAILVDTGSLTDGNWVGEAESVKFTIDGTSGHRRFVKLEITLDGEPAPSEPELETLPENAVSISHIGYAHGSVTAALVMAEDNKTVAELALKGMPDKARYLEYWALAVVGEDGIVTATYEADGSSKGDVVCPAGGYILGAWDSEGTKDSYNALHEVSVGELVTLYNVDLAEVRALEGFKEVKQAGYTHAAAPAVDDPVVDEPVVTPAEDIVIRVSHVNAYSWGAYNAMVISAEGKNCLTCPNVGYDCRYWVAAKVDLVDGDLKVTEIEPNPSDKVMTVSKDGFILYVFAGDADYEAATKIAVGTYVTADFDWTVDAASENPKNPIGTLTFSAEKAQEVEPAETQTYAPATSLKNGDKVVIYNPAYGMALSEEDLSETYPNYRKGVEIAVGEDGKIATADSLIVWEVVVTDEGVKFVADNGSTLSCTGRKLLFGEENNVWTVSAANTDGCVYIVSTSLVGNSGDPVAVEWYADYNEFSSYYLSSTSNESLFAMQLFVLEDAEAGETPSEPTTGDAGVIALVILAVVAAFGSAVVVKTRR